MRSASSVPAGLRTLPRVALLIPSLLACCAPTVPPQYENRAGFARWTETPREYQLGPSDEIAVKFPYNHELDASGPIGPDGRFAVPLVGNVKAAGLTPTDLAEALRQQIASQVKVANVSVAVTRYAHQHVYVAGEVKNAGSFDIDGQAGVLDEIALAGGLLDTARSDSVVLIRRGPDGHPMLRTVDVARYVRTGDVAQDVPVQPLDIVFVPKSSIAEVDRWVDQYLNRALPFSKGLDYTVNGGVIVH